MKKQKIALLISREVAPCGQSRLRRPPHRGQPSGGGDAGRGHDPSGCSPARASAGLRLGRVVLGPTWPGRWRNRGGSRGRSGPGRGPAQRIPSLAPGLAGSRRPGTPTPPPSGTSQRSRLSRGCHPATPAPALQGAGGALASGVQVPLCRWNTDSGALKSLWNLRQRNLSTRSFSLQKERFPLNGVCG